MYCSKYLDSTLKRIRLFDGMFTLPTTEQQEGYSDQNPIKLESIKKVDFQRLLTAIFPELSSCAQGPVVMGCEGWTSVLKLSTLWEFKQMRQEAVNKLSQSPMKPIDKVVLARTYEVEKWLVEGYAELVRRDGGISSEERQTLGLETTLKLYEMREDTFKRGLKSRKRIFNDLEHEVYDRFKAEIIGVRCDGEAFSAAAVPASKKIRRSNDIDSDDDFGWQIPSM